MDCSLPGSWDSRSKNTGVGSHSLLQGRSSWPRSWSWASHIAGRFFTIWATRRPANQTNKNKEQIELHTYVCTGLHQEMWLKEALRIWSLYTNLPLHGSQLCCDKGACITQWSQEPCHAGPLKMYGHSEEFWQTWFTGEGNGKPLQYSCL